jgi:hypothetical protein
MMPIVTPKSWRDNSDEELQQVIDREPGHSANHLAAAAEIQRRQLGGVHRRLERLEKPHWVIWATFVAGAIAAIAAVILLFR